MPVDKTVHEYKKISLKAVINGRDYDLVNFSMTSSVNRIPEARAYVSVGRDIATLKSATIHTNNAELQFLTDVEVFLQVESQNDYDEWPVTPIKIFKGAVTGVSPVVSQGYAQVAIFMSGWQVRMSYSSMLASALGSNAPSYISAGVLSVSGLERNLEPSARGPAAFTGTSLAVGCRPELEQDLWLGLKKYMKAIAEEPTIISTERIPEIEAILNENNEGALDALDAIDTYPGFGLRLNTIENRVVSNGVINHIGAMSTREMTQTSFWDKIMGTYSPSFMFSIVHQVEKSYAVPFLPGSRGIFKDADGRDKTIRPDEYFQISSSSVLNRPIKAVVLSAVSRSYSNLGAARDQPVATHGGIYSANPSLNDGSIIFTSPPPWLSDSLRSGLFAGQFLKTDAKQPTRSATAPNGEGSAANSATSGKAGATPAEAVDTIDELLQLFAKSIYVQESLRNRSASISGRLRFDIAPGSRVRIEGTQDPFIPEDNIFAVDGIAEIVSVSYSFDAQQAVATTSYRMTHIRSELENLSDQFSIAEHPLYPKSWEGMPLIEGF